jgi:tetratricopeptide (TPR) repeat protein
MKSDPDKDVLDNMRFACSSGRQPRQVLGFRLGIRGMLPYNRRMKFSPARSTLVSTLAVALSISIVSAQDPSIDKLLKKLPPPEQVVRADPASQDPLIKQIVNAAKAQNFGQALELSRRLAQRYPKSAGAQAFHAILAFQLRRVDEAADAFRKTIAIQPNLAFAYFGLGAVEFVRRHFAAAIPYFRKSVQLEPKASFNWLFLSACAEKLGRKQESLGYAKRATTASPDLAATWIQLARAESALGHQREAMAAMKRAQQITPAKKGQKSR